MPTVTPKEVKVFTREEPCTKVHLHNCFHQGGRYVRRAVVEARGEIGLNAIKYLKREGLAHSYDHQGIDYWELTESGEDWLAKGLARHLELHPEDASEVKSNRKLAVRRTRR